MKRFTVIMSSVFLFLVGCSGSESDETGQTEDEDANGNAVTLLFSFGSESLDPHVDWVPVRAGVTETLVKINDELELEPWLAESWEQVEEEVWEFELKEDITFHDGEEVDAAAVAASLERALDVNSSLQASLDIETIEAEEQTLTIHTKEPKPMFDSELVNPETAITQVEADDIEEKPIGTGPFEVDDFDPNSRVELTRFDEYWDGKAQLEEATFAFNSDEHARGMNLQTEEADIAYHLAPESLEPIEEDENLSVHSVPSLRTHFLLYQFDNPLLQEVPVREALDLIMDRESVVDDIMGGHADEASGPFHPSLPFASAGEADYSLAEAENILEEDGWEKNEDGWLEKNGEVLDFTVVTYDGRPELPLIAQLFQGEAAQLGINIDIQMVENVDAYLQENDDWDLATYSNLSAPRGDAAYFLNTALTAEGTLNPGNIEDENLEGMIAALNHESDEAKVSALVNDATNRIDEEALQSYIVHPHIIVGVNERVENWEPGSEEYYILTNELDVK